MITEKHDDWQVIFNQIYFGLNSKIVRPSFKFGGTSQEYSVHGFDPFVSITD